MTAAPLENGISPDTHPEVEIDLRYRGSVEVKFLGVFILNFTQNMVRALARSGTLH